MLSCIVISKLPEGWYCSLRNEIPVSLDETRADTELICICLIFELILERNRLKNETMTKKSPEISKPPAGTDFACKVGQRGRDNWCY